MKRDKNNLLVFGTSKNFIDSFNMYKEEFNLFNIIAFIDNNDEKQNKKFMDKIIISPYNINDYDYDYIFIASSFYSDIYMQLVDTININPSKILSQNFFTNLFINKIYTQSYKNRKDSNIMKISTNSKIVVYTAITGNYDILNDPIYINKNFKYVCFTDNCNIRSNIWEINYIKDQNQDYNRKAKKYKVLPHLFLKNYDISIWVDGNFLIIGDLEEYIYKYMIFSNMLCFVHPYRKCIYDEAKVCIELGLDSKNIVKKQMEKYIKDNYPKNKGLAACGILVRKHMSKDVINIMENWWREINEYSKRDQLSFDYVCWKNKFQYDISNLYCYNNNYVKTLPHIKS